MYNAPSIPPTPRPVDTRPLRKRKRVWIGGFLLMAIGSGIGSQGAHDDAVAVAKASVKPAPTVTVTATPRPAVTVTKAARPTPAPTVTITKTATTAHASGSGSGSNSSDENGSASGSGGSGTCSIVSNAGNCYSAGQFCRNSDHGATTTDASGTPITCSLSGSRWRWT